MEIRREAEGGNKRRCRQVLPEPPGSRHHLSLTSECRRMKTVTSGRMPAEAARWDANAVVIESRWLLVASPPLLMRSRLVIISAIVCGIEKEAYSRRRPWRCEKGREGEKKHVRWFDRSALIMFSICTEE